MLAPTAMSATKLATMACFVGRPPPLGKNGPQKLFDGAQLLTSSPDAATAASASSPGFEPAPFASAASFSPFVARHATEHHRDRWRSYSTSAGGKKSTLTAKRTKIIVAERIPNAEIGITLDIAVAMNAITVVEARDGYRLGRAARRVRDATQERPGDDRRFERGLFERVEEDEDVVRRRRRARRRRTRFGCSRGNSRGTTRGR